MKKVCPINATWIFVLMLAIPGSALHAEDPPSAAPVPPALHHALASSLGKATSIGAKAIPTPPAGSWGIVSEGDGGGGIFRDSDSEAETWLGAADVGIKAFGAVAGGYFKDSDSSGYSNVGEGDVGITSFGNFAGGYFNDIDHSGYAYVGYGDIGVEGHGSQGIRGIGTSVGGFFRVTDNSGYSNVAEPNYGIRSYGDSAGGYFEALLGDGYGYVGYGNYGVYAEGTLTGGYFNDSDSSGYAYVGVGENGIEARGNNAGGFFVDSDDSSYAYLGYGHYGVWAVGYLGGGYFEDPDSTAYAYVARGDDGIYAGGYNSGGYFEDTNSSSYAFVGASTSKIAGTGSVSFVQNHPYDPSSVIVYAAPEGDEVATYTRGTARLVDGEATVPLGETFKWVTNPDIGLTAHLTPREDCNGLYLADISTEEVVVRELQNGTSGCAFDYIVYGLRIGFEESSIVQEKKHESYIPSMTDHRQLYERRPDLKSFNSLERFKGMHHAISPKAKLDLSRAHALRDAIIEFDPAVHELPTRPGHERLPENDLATEEAQRGRVQRARAARGDRDRQPATDPSDLSATIPVDDEGNIYTRSYRPPSREVATLVDVSETVEPGDVLVIDRDTAGMMRRGFEGHDSGVVGVVLGSHSPAISEEEVEAETAFYSEVATTGIVTCKVDATYGAIWPGNLLVTSPTPGHAMRTESPLPGTIVGKALEPLEEGVGAIKVLVMLR